MGVRKPVQEWASHHAVSMRKRSTNRENIVVGGCEDGDEAMSRGILQRSTDAFLNLASRGVEQVARGVRVAGRLLPDSEISTPEDAATFTPEGEPTKRRARGVKPRPSG